MAEDFGNCVEETVEMFGGGGGGEGESGRGVVGVR